MDQGDSGKSNVPRVIYESEEDFSGLPLPEFVTLALITCGDASFILNEKAVNLTAPCLMMLSRYDRLKYLESSKLNAVSFSFTPTFLNSSFTFECLEADDFHELEDMHDRNIMYVFMKRDDYYQGIIDLPPQAYLRISEWLAIMGSEICAPSDDFWPCRIRRYLLQTLFLLEDIYMNREIPNTVRREKQQIDIALEYIHTNYASEISLDSLCQLIHLNRTSLNRKFKERTGRTPMDYLLAYRLKIACETLRYTALNLSEIAEALGFKYDTYFIRQFTSKMDISPTEYRKLYGLGLGWSI